MNVNGIVAEYNPLHWGHIYQMEDARHHTNADYTVVVMSGNFVQRGAPAILDKYKRTRMALEAGADLVLELPLPYAVSSAEFFASGAVSLLNKLGVITHLCFGSECGDVEILQELAQILLEEPPAFRSALQQYLKAGLSYPHARTQALLDYQPGLNDGKEILASPNNILGIEYLKALQEINSSITPYTTKRTGGGYLDQKLQEFSSAMAIRKALFAHNTPEALQKHLPSCTYEPLLAAWKENTLLTQNDFSSILLYKLLLEREKGFEEYLDVSRNVSDRIRKHLDAFQSFNDFCDLLKTKEMTYTRISRCLLHILLNIRKDTLVPYEQLGRAPYARVLGFRKDSTPLLAAIKEKSTIPLITKLADAHKLLAGDALTLLEHEITMSQIYQSVLAGKSRLTMANEYRTPIIIL